MNVELIDTHCHLFMDPLSGDVPGVLARAREAMVGMVVVPAYDTVSWSQVTALAEKDGIYPALGLHPWVADQDLDLAVLTDSLRQYRAIAVGEIGLDYKIDQPDRARQREVLEAQLGLACELDLPVILHCRGAFEDLLAALEKFGPGLRGVVHAYTRGPDLARRFVDKDFRLGFGGAITRPKAKRAQRSAAVVPLDNIVLETDAPSIGLDGVPPEQAEPRHVADIAAALAEIRGETLTTIAEVTTANARQLFRI